MSFQPAYHITHVYLDRQSDWLPPARVRQGNYVVFWWKAIALGHLFIKPNQALLAEAYHTALAAAISPAIEHYAGLQQASGTPWQAWLPEQDYERWGAWMEVLLSSWLPVAIPPQVPVSVIICTRNRAAQLWRCLQQLHALPCAPAEIVVVDNAPTDASTYETTKAFSGVAYVRELRAGLDIARNTGIAMAQQPVVLFVDDDVIVHPWLLYSVWETFQEPTTAAITGLVIALALQTEAQLIFEQCWSFNRGYVDKVYSPGFLQATRGQAPPVWEIGAGANMAFRKSVFEEVGYFDELLDAGAAGCSGDSEMWHRILAHGHSIRYVPRAVVFHEHREKMADLKRQLFYYVRGHAVAALIQHEQQPQEGYARRVFWTMPKMYAYLLVRGFPFFRFRSRTLWAEMKGLVAGMVYFYSHRKAKTPR
ncbi:glycosyltransferase family 2 protein [Hymenobacter humi]|uniref:Glycosyltransferase family 2 protein n=1 Tax=Hymenobacter humi TaxID=1411620 RepID=A0ABW2UGV8_9BACT